MVILSLTPRRRSGWAAPRGRWWTWGVPLSPPCRRPAPPHPLHYHPHTTAGSTSCTWDTLPCTHPESRLGGWLSAGWSCIGWKDLKDNQVPGLKFYSSSNIHMYRKAFKELPVIKLPRHFLSLFFSCLLLKFWTTYFYPHSVSSFHPPNRLIF